MRFNSALISVYKKEGIEEFASFLSKHCTQLISTGGTAKKLQSVGLTPTTVENVTDFPEILAGRVKTLHPKIHAGILAKRKDVSHMNILKKNVIPQIDIVVVNLYPFSEIKKKAGEDEGKTLEGIDIGGPTLIRAAAKNFKDVMPVIDPSDYELVISFIKNNKVDIEFRRYLAKKAFDHTKFYEHQISEYFKTSTLVMQKVETEDCIFKDGPETEPFASKKTSLESQIPLVFTRSNNLRYGENPHQLAAAYHLDHAGGLLNAKLVQGESLSFNNLVDADTAVNCCKSLNEPAAVIVKHANPCGVAIAKNNVDAFSFARSTDPKSSFGGVLALNSELDKKLAGAIKKYFFEVVIAPSISLAAKEILKEKNNLRLLCSSKLFSKETLSAGILDIKKILGGYLIQLDEEQNSGLELKVVTKKEPTKKEFDDLMFAWKISKWVKSNAIVFCKDQKTLGIGAGQMSRIDSTNIAIMKAKEFSHSLTGSAVASDAFFPFRDGLDLISKTGASCVIQPGGSKNDKEVIAVANDNDISMIFTNLRQFRH
ncbi:MAG: bifunctional phosphoribosylaminoimidazolecarboxamide formyltransferase/IMP cyclohydrolase [Betaproteobacteria bacterium TMED82]|nr:MAG: bifunctional phosphoribosylaminoimidazolecarboxamide formyltransferase/IMP cyclohydrolase [Betaproteobacteria bacterium TMED82]|tara:strand:+ start:22457 stop:24079 length:1623 start_codon:yes stop_codon:yes gene_type:complete